MSDHCCDVTLLLYVSHLSRYRRRGCVYGNRSRQGNREQRGNTNEVQCVCVFSLLFYKVVFLCVSARLDPVVAAAPRPRAVKSLLSKPNVSTIFPTESIAFSR